MAVDPLDQEAELQPEARPEPQPPTALQNAPEETIEIEEKTTDSPAVSLAEEPVVDGEGPDIFRPGTGDEDQRALHSKITSGEGNAVSGLAISILDPLKRAMEAENQRSHDARTRILTSVLQQNAIYLAQAEKELEELYAKKAEIETEIDDLETQLELKKAELAVLEDKYGTEEELEEEISHCKAECQKLDVLIEQAEDNIERVRQDRQDSMQSLKTARENYAQIQENQETGMNKYHELIDEYNSLKDEDEALQEKLQQAGVITIEYTTEDQVPSFNFDTGQLDGAALDNSTTATHVVYQDEKSGDFYIKSLDGSEKILIEDKAQIEEIQAALKDGQTLGDSLDPALAAEHEESLNNIHENSRNITAFAQALNDEYLEETRVEGAIASAEREFARIDKSLVGLEENLAELQARRDKLQERLEQKQAQLEEIQAVKGDIAKLEADLERLEARKTEIDHAIAEQEEVVAYYEQEREYLQSDAYKENYAQYLETGDIEAFEQNIPESLMKAFEAAFDKNLLTTMRETLRGDTEESLDTPPTPKPDENLLKLENGRAEIEAGLEAAFASGGFSDADLKDFLKSQFGITLSSNDFNTLKEDLEREHGLSFTAETPEPENRLAAAKYSPEGAELPDMKGNFGSAAPGTKAPEPTPEPEPEPENQPKPEVPGAAPAA